MKRLINILLIVLFTLVIGIIRVDASSYNGKLYEVWHPDSGFTVFAEESNRYMDYNSWMIKSTIDNKIYYCIDPSTPLEGASSGSHDLITNKSDILSISGMNETKYRKIQLLAYYGYGYKDSNIDHTNKKWYGITQVMIWRVMRPDLTWTFKKDRNSAIDNNLYSKEVKELSDLVEDYLKLPSFSNKTIIMKAGDTNHLEDTNHVFNKYSLLQGSKNVTLKPNGNSLDIYSEESGLYRIGYNIVPATNDKFGALVSSDFQDLIVMGKPDEQRFFFNVEVRDGLIKIQKLDKDNNERSSGNASFEGALFGIYDMDKNLIDKVTTDKNGFAKISLPFGSYKVKELEPPLGYKINNDEFEVVLDGVKGSKTINVYDEVIKGKIEITKTKGGSGEKFVPESDAKFKIFNKDNVEVGELTTSKSGKASIMLPYGEYVLKQINGADGYVFSKDIEISIKEDKTYNLDIKNIKKSVLDFSKTDYSLDIPVPDTLIEIYKDDDELIYSGRTDKNGKIILPGLDIGKYYILEKDAPKYYRLNNEKMNFEVKDNGLIIKANMKNYRKEGSLTILKKDSNTGQLLKGAFFDIYLVGNDKPMFKGVTNKDGELNIKTLIAGKYCIVETKAPDGYKLSKDKHCFELSEDAQNVKMIIKNSKNTINVPKTNAFNIIGIISSILLISGSSYYIYEKFN